MLHVVIRGAPKGNKPAILTYHDVGLNRECPKKSVCVCVRQQMLLLLCLSEVIIGLHVTLLHMDLLSSPAGVLCHN